MIRGEGDQALAHQVRFGDLLHDLPEALVEVIDPRLVQQLDHPRQFVDLLPRETEFLDGLGEVQAEVPLVRIVLVVHLLVLVHFLGRDRLGFVGVRLDECCEGIIVVWSVGDRESSDDHGTIVGIRFQLGQNALEFDIAGLYLSPRSHDVLFRHALRVAEDRTRHFVTAPEEGVIAILCEGLGDEVEVLAQPARVIVDAVLVRLYSGVDRGVGDARLGALRHVPFEHHRSVCEAVEVGGVRYLRVVGGQVVLVDGAGRVEEDQPRCSVSGFLLGLAAELQDQ